MRGPSITPRPPQGQPLVTSLAHASTPYDFAARGSDLVYVTPRDRAGAEAALAQVDDAVEGAGRNVRDRPLGKFADLVVFLDEEPGAAARHEAHLDDLNGAALSSDAEIFAGTPGDLADLMLD